MQNQITTALVSDIEGIQKLLNEVDALHLKLLPSHFKNLKNGRRKKEIEDWVLNKKCLYLVCKDGEEIIGILNARIANTPTLPFIRKIKTMVIETLVVSKKKRNTGIGSELLSHAEAWAIRKRAKRITLNVFVKNETAIEFYQNKRFKDVSVKMEKEIRSQ